ncbi:family 6 glucosyltransferase [Mucilaginibacter sp.]|uniref:family 6 glucosyltransferase n=1 Tax=Mucilaginibacter sp. TaxID=1882438 RepID=UPI002626D2DD|nr:family 6 glucosyltransferase [Mucilaginibacter sp.]MDB4919622.1 hypothetical protein [Mucilaginibacter sp.]
MIGILYICTGKYAIFWKKFFLSAEKFLFPGHEKKYFVFTDAQQLYAEKSHKIQKIYQETLGWPYDTLFRFKMFLGVEEYLKKCDYLLFFNANIVFVDTIGPTILPSETNDGLLAVKHPGFWDKPSSGYLYDRNSGSTAYIPEGDGEHYFMGGFNGGQTAAYLLLIKTLNNNIHTDLDKDVIALWHDESHLNRYLLDKNPKILSPAYGFVEGYDIPFKPKLIVLLKEKYGGHDYLRNISDKKLKHSKISFKKIKSVAKKLSCKLGFLKYRQ